MGIRKVKAVCCFGKSSVMWLCGYSWRAFGERRPKAGSASVTEVLFQGQKGHLHILAT